MSAASNNILSRWQARIYRTGCSPLGFLELVIQKVREAEFPKLRFSEVRRRENGLLSSDRTYLRIRYRSLYFDVSALLAGHALVVGYWLHADKPGISDLISEIPGAGWLIRGLIKPATYFQVDHNQAFQHMVHDSVLEVVRSLAEGNDARHLDPASDAPVWEEISL